MPIHIRQFFVFSWRFTFDLPASAAWRDDPPPMLPQTASESHVRDLAE
jgi:hypothetical protein